MYSCLDTNVGNKVCLINEAIENIEVIDNVIIVVLKENEHDDDQWVMYLTLDGTLISAENLNK